MLTTIQLSISEMVYDIQNKTYLTGKSHADGANFREIAQMQANNDEDNLNQILRSMQTAISNLRQETGEWANEMTGDYSNCQICNPDEEVTIKVRMPSNFNNAATRSLIDSMHQYIVAFAVSEWFVITNKEDAAQYAKIAAEALTMVGRALSQRVRPNRPNHGSDD